MGSGISISKEDMVVVQALLDAEELIEKLSAEGVHAKVVGGIARFEESNLSAKKMNFDSSSDIDIAVSPADFERAKQICEQFADSPPIESNDYYIFSECKFVDKRFEEDGHTIHLIGSLTKM